jgi:hypothetical protein
MGTCNVETKDKTRINFIPYVHLPNVVFLPLFYVHISHVSQTWPITNRLFIIEVGVLIIYCDQFFCLGAKFHQVAIYFKLAKKPI